MHIDRSSHPQQAWRASTTATEVGTAIIPISVLECETRRGKGSYPQLHGCSAVRTNTLPSSWTAQLTRWQEGLTLAQATTTPTPYVSRHLHSRCQYHEVNSCRADSSNAQTLHHNMHEGHVVVSLGGEMVGYLFLSDQFLYCLIFFFLLRI